MRDMLERHDWLSLLYLQPLTPDRANDPARCQRCGILRVKSTSIVATSGETRKASPNEIARCDVKWRGEL